MTHTPPSNRPPIYSVGYEHETQDSIAELLDRLHASLVDVRGSLFRCKSGFGPRQLESRFGDRYVWMGPTLGNRPPNTVQPAGIEYLLNLDHPVILMCKEHAPGECHRHFQIAVRLLTHVVDVRHIYEDVIVLASELQRSLEEDGDRDDGYSYIDLKSELDLVDRSVASFNLERVTNTGELGAPDYPALRS